MRKKEFSKNVQAEIRTMTAEDFAANCDAILREGQKKLLKIIVTKNDKPHGMYISQVG